MSKWEFSMYCKTLHPEGMIGSRTSASQLWDEDYKDDEGKTASEVIAGYGQDGWELVSVTPVSTAAPYPGRTEEILFTFKRPA